MGHVLYLYIKLSWLLNFAADFEPKYQHVSCPGLQPLLTPVLTKVSVICSKEDLTSSLVSVLLTVRLSVLPGYVR